MGESDKHTGSSSQYSNTTYRSSPIRSRRAFLAATAATSTALFAGCGGDGDENGGNTGTTEGSPGQETVELLWWHQENVQARIDRFEQLNQSFMDEHPNIEVRQEPQTWGGIYGKLQSALSAGNEPDFWFNTPILAQEFHARDHLADVSEMQDELNSEYSYFDETVSQYTYDDGQWGIPNWNKGFQYFWRSDTFGDVDNWPPEDWEQWQSGMAEVTGGDVNGFVLGAANTHFAYKEVYNILAMKGAHIFGPDGGVMFNTDETVQALDFYKQVWNSAVPGSAVDWSWPEWDRSLREGTVHSSSCYTAPIPYLDESQQQNWDTLEAGNPTPADGGQWGGGQDARFVSIDGVSVFNEDKMDAITTYMKYIHRPDVYGTWMRELNPTLFVPVHEEGMNADAYWEGAHADGVTRKMVEVQQNLDNMAYPGLTGMHQENNTYVGQGIGAIEGSFPLGSIANQLINEDRSPQEAAEWGQSHLEDVTGIGASNEL